MVINHLTKCHLNSNTRPVRQCKSLKLRFFFFKVREQTRIFIFKKKGNKNFTNLLHIYTICRNFQTNYKTTLHKCKMLLKLRYVLFVRIKAFCSSRASFLIPQRFMRTTLAQVHVITVGSSYQPAFKGGYARRVSISGFPAVTLSFHVLAKWHIHSLTSNNKFTVLEL